MRVMTMLEQVRTAEDLDRVRGIAMSRSGWTPELFAEKAKPVLKRIAQLAKPTSKQIATAKQFTPTLVENYGWARLKLVPHDGSSERKPLPELATIQTVPAKRCQFKRKERVVVGPVVISTDAWDTLSKGGVVKVWVGPSKTAHMHYASLV